MKLTTNLAWKIMLAWFIAIMIIFVIAREWVVFTFGTTYGLIFGGLAYRYRSKVRPFFKRIGLDNYRGFLILAIIVSVTEETYVYILGGDIAHPVLWIDLVLVTGMWTVWFGTWYFYLSKKYAFSEKEALMTAGFIGVFYEYIGTGKIIENPLLIISFTPLAVIIYAAIFMLPMQLINFTGENESKMKYPVSVILPFILTIPVAIALYIIFSIFQIPLDV
jgi:hypothetical protein